MSEGGGSRRGGQQPRDPQQQGAWSCSPDPLGSSRAAVGFHENCGKQRPWGRGCGDRAKLDRTFWETSRLPRMLEALCLRITARHGEAALGWVGEGEGRIGGQGNWAGGSVLSPSLSMENLTLNLERRQSRHPRGPAQSGR